MLAILSYPQGKNVRYGVERVNVLVSRYKTKGPLTFRNDSADWPWFRVH
jgi:hypothetical protein